MRPASHRSAQSTRYEQGAQLRTRWMVWMLSVAFGIAAPAISAQTARPQRQIGPITYPTSDASDRIRLSQLAGDTSHLGAYLLRSPSTILFGDTALVPAHRALQWLAPDIHVTVNSSIPLSLNEGGMWAGRGVSTRLTGGAKLSTGRHWSEQSVGYSNTTMLCACVLSARAMAGNSSMQSRKGLHRSLS